MPISLREITSEQVWNDFITTNFHFYSFLQSWQWGEFQKSDGEKIWRLGIFDGQKQIGAAHIIKISAKRGTFLFCPHGPLITDNYFQTLKEILPGLKKLAREEGACFIRFNPALQATIENEEDFHRLGFRNAPMHVHVESTWILDIRPSEEALSADLRKTTRYLIRRAEKEGVEIKQENSPEEIDLFYKLHTQHSQRERGHKYAAFSRQYINNLFTTFGRDIKMMSAWYKGRCEASLATIRFGSFCVYYLGASDIKHPKFSPAYLLQWRAIMDAKEFGCKFYNFWGVAPDDNPKHPIYGVSRFKKGYGGFGYELLHAQDLPLGWKYWLNWLIETVRRWRRGYFYPRPVSTQEFTSSELLA